ncbi:7379_t:CDS:2 [Funneliformis caledonium]|uniref:7379_t:CDS:1 n=2 Tax=Funneliformis TaxID=1117308 RepID=A0A9N8WEU0_9GLOM|nr:7379_t:CDS:2 [Funneliformis caledonium]CAG8534961.1 9629_t:CDS:2 [Funneliformis mosseae]
MRLFERLNREVEIVQMDDVDENLKDPRELENDDHDQLFRLFARDPPTKISLESKDIKDYDELVQQMRRKKFEIDELSDDPERIEKINSVTITFEQIIQESKIPWERHLMPHKVLHVPYKEAEQKFRSKRRKSKKRRVAEKKGLVKKHQGGKCPGWPSGGKEYTYGWKSSAEIRNVPGRKDSKIFRGRTNFNRDRIGSFGRQDHRGTRRK